MSDRALLIGIDGLDMNQLDRLLGQAEFPNLRRIVMGGARAKLKSVIPLNSASAWTSLLTGKNPAGHGVFGFVRSAPDLLRRHTVRCDDVGAAPIWEIANAHHAPVGLINCPMTWPPPAIDGFVVSGIPVPYNQLWASPPEIEEKLRDRFGPYIVDLPWWDLADGTPGRYESFIAGLYHMARKREEVTLWAMRNRPWRILGVIFTGTDRLLHSFWRHADSSHPYHDKPGGDAHGRDILRYFVLLDEIIGRIIETAGKDVPVILASDHGFGPLHHRFHIRRWLENRRYLVPLPDGQSAPGDELLDPPLRGIDWQKTVAYPASLSESGVWINKVGRQPGGIVSNKDYEMYRERIAKELVDSLTDGSRPIENALRREDKLAGPYLEEAPDLLLAPRDNFIVDDSPSPVEIAPSYRETATHRAMGIFAAYGEGFRNGVELPAHNIVDVLPTLLAMTGIPLPAGLDGKPALDAFDSPPRVIESTIVMPPRTRRKLPESDSEEEAMKNRLKGIGYL